MIMHIWMHWFWITTSYLKGFLFFTAQTISFSCISHPFVAEAGLLENLSPTSVAPKYYKESEDGDPNVSSPTEFNEGNPETSTRQSSGPGERTGTEESPMPPKNEDVPKNAFDSTSDLEDTYKGGTLDVSQYTLKKFVKYSHLKYGKVKAKGKPVDETDGEEPKSENPKEVGGNVDANLSTTAEGGFSYVEVDKSNDGPSTGTSPELPTSEAPDLMTATFAFENATREEGPGKSSKAETEAPFSSSTERVSEVLPPPGEDQSEMQILKNETLMIENKVEEIGGYTTVEPSAVKNRVAASTSAQNFEVHQSELNVGSITGITLGILVVFSLFGAVSFVLYRRRYLNKPQVLHDKCSNLDSSGYIDESSVRENSEEMYSLDNDSFLNSLEAMTIQNYWTENVKHTKL